MEQVRRAIRLRHYSRRTEEAYAGWIRRYIRFHGIRHPDALGPEHITSFLSALPTDGHVSASTQNQALCAVLFMYRVVLGRDLGDIQGVVRARASKRLPVVLSRSDVKAVLAHLGGHVSVGSGPPVWRRAAPARGARTARQGSGPRARTGDRSARKGEEGPGTTPPGSAVTLAGVLPVDFTCMNRPFSGWSQRPFEPPESSRRPRVTPLDIRSRHISWRTVTTSALCRNCSATATSAPP